MVKAKDTAEPVVRSYSGSVRGSGAGQYIALKGAVRPVDLLGRTRPQGSIGVGGSPARRRKAISAQD